MAELDQEFVEYVVKSLVANPDAVKVDRSVDEMGVLLELSVDSEDMGKVIGKGGATAKSIRTLLRVLGAKNDARVNLKIIEPEGSEGRMTQAAPEQEAPIAEPAVGPAAEMQPDQPSDLRAQTQRDIEELADLEI